jgi:hypothetical protein
MQISETLKAEQKQLAALKAQEKGSEQFDGGNGVEFPEIPKFPVEQLIALGEARKKRREKRNSWWEFWPGIGNFLIILYAVQRFTFLDILPYKAQKFS